MIRKEKQAVYDTLGIATSNSLESSTSLAASEIGAGTYYGGWLLWNAANDYFTSSTEGALDGK